MKLKIPKLTIKRPAFLTRKPAKSKPVTLHAATARMRAEDEFDDEPQTRLSSAFFVVLILHVVAVGGIYAFNSIKAHRKGLEPTPVSAKPEVQKKAAAEPPASAAAKPNAAPAPEVAPKLAGATAAPSQLATMPVSNGKVYHVKPGDTLSKIAQQTGVSVAALQFVNKDTATLRPNQILNIPAKTASAAANATIEPPAPNPIAKKSEAPKSAAGTVPSSYEVQKNDTATSIAKRFNVSVDELLKVNKVSDPKKLQLGQKLSIPTKKN
jgi:LysM repeat protein